MDNTVARSHAAPMQFSRLTPSFGAVVSGINLSEDISPGIQEILNKALLKHQVLLFRHQSLTEDEQIGFAQGYGTCRQQWQSRHYPSNNILTHYLSNVLPDGSPAGVHPDPDSIFWHIDGSWSRHPYKATVLYAVQATEGYGNTQFANLYQLYDELDQATKDRFAKQRAEHNLKLSRAARQGLTPRQWWRTKPTRPPLKEVFKWWAHTLSQRGSGNTVLHPLVRPHPETGRPVLFIGDHAWRIAGRPWPAGIRLMKQINKLPIRPEIIYTHQWQRGDLLIWDNQSILHRSQASILTEQPRIMRRCVVLNPAEKNSRDTNKIIN